MTMFGARTAGLGTAMKGLSGMSGTQLGGMLGGGPLTSGAGAVLGGALSAGIEGAEFTPEMMRSAFGEGAGMGLRTMVGQGQMRLDQARNPHQIWVAAPDQGRQPADVRKRTTSYMLNPNSPTQSQQINQQHARGRGPLSRAHQYQAGSAVVDPMRQAADSIFDRLGKISGWLQQRGDAQ